MRIEIFNYVSCVLGCIALCILGCIFRVQSTDETILKSKATSNFFTLQFLVYLYSDKPLQVTIYKGTFFYNKFYKKIISDI